MTQTDSDDATQVTPPAWPGWLIATATCIRFYSRLPVPALPGENVHALPDFQLVPRALPFAALVIALPAALIALLAGLAGVNALLTAALAVTALVVTTGAFHEDGLADSADGLFGGHTPERRLEIMKDSRVGTFGALALGLSLLLRVSALAAILQGAGAWTVAAAVLVAAPWSRVEGLRILATTPPTRRDGASAAVGQPERSVLPVAYGLSAGLALVLVAAGALPLTGIVLGLAVSALTTLWLSRTAIRLIGGQTGDILGAAQQLGEIAIYLGLAIVIGWGGR
ncbi:adenosylcobinamide-GDP ribazoletransferase [Bosea sp. CRIB-10]|uniref:adenosylcobinamide-GDP ribazoletransferase n=1 Tax=Bosea sp. CRIB-10 TaxID=378404 RepID=UPI0008EFB64F|nr:adenosylcobinamide-GDP ribazoletransferase [Bosea sp. CRIB-10]SFC27075.1 adenosylcobinamide-GDP ribazoletransferase [Bosea sp. CRIB-10]